MSSKTGLQVVRELASPAHEALGRLDLIRAKMHEAKSAREAARSTENLDIADGHWERFDECLSELLATIEMADAKGDLAIYEATLGRFVEA